MFSSGKKSVVILMIVILLTFAIFSIVIIGAIYRQNNERKELRLIETTELRKEIIVQRLDYDFQILRGLAASLQNFDFSDEAELIETLNRLNQTNSFNKLGVADMDGNTILVDLDGVTYQGINLSESELFQRTLRGEEVFNEDFYNAEFYAVPIYKQSEITAVLCVFNTDVLVSNLMEASVFRGEGGFMMLDSIGRIVMPIYRDTENILDLATFNQQERERFAWSLNDPIGGQTPYLFNMRLDGVQQTGVVVNVGINNWHVLSLIPRHSMDTYYNMAAFGTAAVVIFAALLISLLLYGYTYSLNKSRMELEAVAYIDPLTGTRNINKFLLDVNEIISSEIMENYAIWVFDIKKFAFVNNIFGNTAGDRLLSEVARVFEENSPRGSIFCHMSGDLFAGLRTYSQEGELLNWFNRLHGAFETRHMVSGNRMHIDFSMGFYCLDFNVLPSSISDMIHRASVARHYAKSFEGSKAAVFTHEMSEKLSREAEINASGRMAIDKGELIFFLQPKVNIQDGYQIAGAEALVRWNHPRHGRMSPAEFIPVFEANGFIIQMDRYIFEQICAWFSGYLKDGGTPFNVAVNVSRQGLLQEDFISYYTSVKQKYDLPDRLVELEFTESVMSNDYHMFHDKVEILRTNGFICSIDDFGSGYSSLNVIKNITIDVLKLDAAFFRDGDTNRGHVVVESFVKMAKELSIKTVAEGVEHIAQLEFLKEIGCDVVQGYIFSKPLPVEEFKKLVERGFIEPEQMD